MTKRPTTDLVDLLKTGPVKGSERGHTSRELRAITGLGKAQLTDRLEQLKREGRLCSGKKTVEGLDGSRRFSPSYWVEK